MKIKTYLLWLVSIIYIWVLTILTVYFLQIINPSAKNELYDWNIAITGTEDIWANLKKEEQISVFSWWLVISSQDEKKYPKIKINSPIKKWTIFYTIEISDNLKNSWYLKSSSYYFAFRFFIANFENGGYYKVFRKTNSWVWNDYSSWLDGAISWIELNWWYTWEIPLAEKVPISRNKWEYWYTYINTLDFINSNIWKEISLWWYLSSVKEFPEWWWMTTKIKSIVISYEWNKGALELVK